MQAAGCGGRCVWEPSNANLAIEDVHMAIRLTELSSWIDDVKAIYAKDFFSLKRLPGLACLPIGYHWIRFVRGGGADLLSPGAGLARPVMVQQSYMRSRTSGLAPIKYSWVLDAVEQLTLCK